MNCADNSESCPGALEELDVTDVLDRICDGFYILDEEGNLVQWNAPFPEQTGYSDEEISSMDPIEFFAEEDRERITTAISRVLEGEQVEGVRATVIAADGERIPYELNGTPITDGDGSVVGLAGIAREITGLRKRERALTAQRDELERLHGLNMVTRDIHTLLVRAQSRDEVERAVCDRLTDEETYKLAWIGSVNPTRGTVVVRRSAGDGAGFLDEFAIKGEAASCLPTVRAVTSGEPTIVQNFRSDQADERWQEAATERGFGSSAAIPITCDGVKYGVLGVYATIPGAFDRREQRVLQELCEAMGYALNAIARKEALTGDALAEITYEIDGATPFESIVEHGGELRFERVLSVDDETSLWYVTMEDLPPGAADQLGTEVPWIDAVEQIEDADGTRFQFTVSGLSDVRRLADHGVLMRSFSARPGTPVITVKTPEESVHAATEVVRELFPSAAPVSKRTVERNHPTPMDLSTAVAEILTERQRTVLEAAYSAGYFDRSRAMSGKDIAESMGVSRATFHEHLRTAQRKLLDVAFAEFE